MERECTDTVQIRKCFRLILHLFGRTYSVSNEYFFFLFKWIDFLPDEEGGFFGAAILLIDQVLSRHSFCVKHP